MDPKEEANRDIALLTCCGLDNILKAFALCLELPSEHKATGKNVYVIRDGAYLKIGIANNCEKRLATLQIGNPRTLHLEFSRYTENPLTVERRIHRHFKDALVHSEWFTGISMDNVIKVINDAIDKQPKADRQYNKPPEDIAKIREEIQRCFSGLAHNFSCD